MRPLALLLLIGSSCTLPRFAFDVDKEEGLHEGAAIEWWYHFGWLTDEDGGEWAWVSSFFRVAPKGTRYLIYDLIDLKTGRAEYRSLMGSEAVPALLLVTGKSEPPSPHGLIPGEPVDRPGELRLAYAEDRLERTGPRRYRLKVGPVDVRLEGASPAMAVEGTGLTGLKEPGDMHYYSVPRLAAEGTVRGRKARGLFWYDHQWGSSWVGPTIGWSWWGLHLDDGSAVNAYVLREVGTGKILRSVLTHDRRVAPLRARPVETWESPTRIRYPVSWELEGGGLRLRVNPIFKEREVPILGLQESIWEGPVRVTGTHGGRGFQELVSYARDGRPR